MWSHSPDLWIHCDFWFVTHWNEIEEHCIYFEVTGLYLCNFKFVRQIHAVLTKKRQHTRDYIILFQYVFYIEACKSCITTSKQGVSCSRLFHNKRLRPFQNAFNILVSNGVHDSWISRCSPMNHAIIHMTKTNKT